MIRLAAIGYGDIARRARLPDLLQHRAKAELVAIAGRDRRKLEANAAAFGVRRTYVDLEAMLSEPDIDGVLILTPPCTHADLTVAAVDAGKHVLVEKPLTTTLQDAKRIVAAVEKRPVVVAPLPDVATEVHAQVRSLLDSGAVGEVTAVECHRGHRGPTHAGWFYRKEMAGGGVLLDLGIYALTEVVDLFGPATSLSALCATRFPQRVLDDGTVVDADVEDVALLELWLEHGVAASIHASWNGYASHHHTRTRTTVYGREGMLAYGMPQNRILLHRDDGHYPEGGTPAPFDGLQGQAFATSGRSGQVSTVVGRFLERIARQDLDLAPLRRQVHVMEVVIAAYAASRSATAFEPAAVPDRF